MNLLNFMSNFADEESCVTYLKEQRERRGVVCKHCNSTEHHWDAHKRCFECRNCHSSQSLRSGTVMQNSKLPFRYWIATMFLLMSTKKSFSTEEIRHQLGHKRCQPVWEMVCKFREAWVNVTHSTPWTDRSSSTTASSPRNVPKRRRIHL